MFPSLRSTNSPARSRPQEVPLDQSAALALAGAVIAVPQAVSTSSPGLSLTIAGAALALAPGVWLLVGLAVTVLGWAPRLTPLCWAVIGWSLFVTWVGALLNLPQLLLESTPFQQLPKLPVEQLTWTPILVETSLAVVLIAFGLAGFRRRDLTG